MENTNCLVCGTNKQEIFCSGYDRLFGINGDFDLVKCTNCGFIYLDPRPTKKEMRKYYPEDYYSFRRWEEQIGLPRSFYRILKWKYLSRDKHTRFPGVPRYLRNGKLLDFGCGSGEVLGILKNIGWQVVGVEIDADAAGYARSKGLEVFNEDLKAIHFPDNHFDVIRMRSVLEHLHEAPVLLDEFHRILKRGGQLLLIVPNIKSIDFKIFKERWYLLDIPRHLYHFSTETLKILLENFSFHDTSFRICGGGAAFLASIDYFLNEKRGTFGLRLADKKYLRIPVFLLFEIWLNILGSGNLIEARAYKT